MTDEVGGSKAVEALRASRAPFGAENRQRLIAEFMRSGVVAADAPLWESVYRLLLWVDKTNGLGHCYESDKCQPGKPWYQRSLRFHDWLATSLKCTPAEVGLHLDWLFRRTADEFAAEVMRTQQAKLDRATKQTAEYQGRGFPEPGEDPAIIAIIRDILGSRIAEEPTQHEWLIISQRIREVIAVENKRKNLVGEGFEDVLAAVIAKAGEGRGFEVSARKALHTIPGFSHVREGEKVNKVDLAVIDTARDKQTLVTVKWSVRADREKQFQAEFDGYAAARSNHKTFGYTLITNEFDPARLARACDAVSKNHYMFTHVVHINPDALKAVYGSKTEDSMGKVLQHIIDGRLLSLDGWLAEMKLTG
jgi:hypothetical protein